MHIKDAVVLVTGANRGLGRAWASLLLQAGARKVYACARDASTVDLPGVIALELDITRPDQVARAAAQCSDVTLLINNAGIVRGGDLLAEDAPARARGEAAFFRRVLVAVADRDGVAAALRSDPLVSARFRLDDAPG